MDFLTAIVIVCVFAFGILLAASGSKKEEPVPQPGHTKEELDRLVFMERLRTASYFGVNQMFKDYPTYAQSAVYISDKGVKIIGNDGTEYKIEVIMVEKLPEIKK